MTSTVGSGQKIEAEVSSRLAGAQRMACCLKGCGGFEVVTLLVLSILVGLGWSGILPMNIVTLGILTAFIPLTIIFSYFLFNRANWVENQANGIYAANVEAIETKNFETEKKIDEYRSVINRCNSFMEKLKAFRLLNDQDKEQAIKIVVEGRAHLSEFNKIKYFDLIKFKLVDASADVRLYLSVTLDNLMIRYKITEEELTSASLDASQTED